jgi:transcriptional regulator of nitric oxide reductase
LSAPPRNRRPRLASDAPALTAFARIVVGASSARAMDRLGALVQSARSLPGAARYGNPDGASDFSATRNACVRLGR